MPRCSGFRRNVIAVAIFGAGPDHHGHCNRKGRRRERRRHRQWKVAGRHTLKAGGYLNHSYKAQNVGAGGIANLTFQGYVNFGNDTTNALDSGFGYSNAALGIFTQYLQASKFIEGNLLYNQLEFYVQDNWKVNNRLTLDYGLRFVHQQPQYDSFNNMSNFFADKWKASDAAVFYVAGCNNGATVCSGNSRNAMDPRTGQILVAPGAANSQAAIGTPIPGTGNPLNGIIQAGNGIANTNYLWPALVVGPRFGFAYDVNGKSDWVVRGGVGLFYDRPDGNTVFSPPAIRRSRPQPTFATGNFRPWDRGSPRSRYRRWSPSSTTHRSHRRGSGR